MVYPKPIKTLIVFVLISLVKCDFTPLGDWLLYKQSSTDNPTAIPNQQNSGSPSIANSDASAITVMSCYSLSIDQKSINLEVDYSTLITGLSEFTIGFWVNFQMTPSSNIFTFGSDSGPHYIVSSTTNGDLKVSYYQDISTTDSNSDFGFTVPTSNFYIGSWIFIAFNFKDVSGAVTLNVIVSGVGKFSKTQAVGSTVPFQLPDGNLRFGETLTAIFYEIILTSSADISADFKTITFTDSSSNSIPIVQPCAADTCMGDLCTSDGTCIYSRGYCQACTAGKCDTCISGANRNTADYCQTCAADNTLKGGYCNFYLGCLTSYNCKSCANSPAICDRCADDDSFLLLNMQTFKVSCICNLYVACTNSCNDCLPGPDCYECTDLIVQQGNTCVVIKYGYQVSVEIPNIVIDFAYLITSELTIGSLSATSSTGKVITTDNWIITSCAPLTQQCIIQTDNLHESDLPIQLDLEFDQSS